MELQIREMETCRRLVARKAEADERAEICGAKWWGFRSKIQVVVSWFVSCVIVACVISAILCSLIQGLPAAVVRSGGLIFLASFIVISVLAAASFAWLLVISYERDKARRSLFRWLYHELQISADELQEISRRILRLDPGSDEHDALEYHYVNRVAARKVLGQIVGRLKHNFHETKIPNETEFYSMMQEEIYQWGEADTPVFDFSAIS